MSSILRYSVIVLVLAATCFAGELPDAPSSSIRTRMELDPAMISAVAPSIQLQQSTPEHKIVDKKFLALAVISTGSTFADSFTTMFATQNWLGGKKGVCNMEVQSAYLYGVHPTAGRAYAVASVKSAGALATAYFLRKHHSKFWSAALLGNTAISLEGVTQNMINCN